MSEYWKSTPKYWCKFCKTYVRDTKFEREQHEATPKHQTGIQRSLRELHRNKEQEEREKQRAKNEVARLNGVVGGGGSSSTSVAGGTGGAKPEVAKDAPRQATVEERKRQLKQLAEMGVAVPEEFRREMAMAGEWQTMSVTPLEPGAGAVKKEGDSKEDLKPEVLNIGVRKRKVEDEEEDEEARETTRKKGWGNSFKTYPGSKGNTGDDIEALLSGAGSKATVKSEPEVKQDPDAPVIKKEESVEEGGVPDPAVETEQKPADAAVKAEEDGPAEGAGVVFKKRKSKALRQK